MGFVLSTPVLVGLMAALAFASDMFAYAWLADAWHLPWQRPDAFLD